MSEKIVIDPMNWKAIAGVGTPVLLLLAWWVTRAFPQLLKSAQVQDEIADRMWQRAKGDMERMESRLTMLEAERLMLKQALDDRDDEIRQNNKEIRHLFEKLEESNNQRDKFENLYKSVSGGM